MCSVLDSLISTSWVRGKVLGRSSLKLRLGRAKPKDSVNRVHVRPIQRMCKQREVTIAEGLNSFEESGVSWGLGHGKGNSHLFQFSLEFSFRKKYLFF